jgi:type I restriction enzyme S subunit
MNLNQYSVSAAQPGLSVDVIRRLAVPVPNEEEQRAIAAFLDRETAKIDALVSEQERLIALLQEKRQAVITQAVTKGLDPDVPMKESGVEWIGEIPSHWTMKPLMRLTQPDRPIMYGIVLPGPDVGVGVPILKGGNVKPARMNLESLARTTEEIEAPYARARLRAGDLVYAIRGTIGDCELVPPELENCNITQDVARVAPLLEVDADWLRFALLSHPLQEHLACGSLGAAVRGVNIFDLKRVSVPMPPQAEQVAISVRLRNVCATIDELIDGANNSERLLLERRAALITAAVTGQIDVRGLASAEAA